MARPTKLTATTTRKLCEAIEMGATYELACQAAGISYSTFRSWMHAAQRGEDKRKVAFAAKVEAAQSASATHALAVIRAAAEAGDWKAAAWLLERRHSYTRTEKVEATVEATAAPPRLDLLTDEELAMLDDLSRRASADAA